VRQDHRELQDLLDLKELKELLVVKENPAIRELQVQLEIKDRRD
jgi:ribosomal protein L30/L7E